MDYDDPGPATTALPLYFSACQLTLCLEAEGYEDRAWTRCERALSYAFSPGGDVPFVIPSSGLGTNRTIVPKTEHRLLSNPRAGELTYECDRHLINWLSRVAEDSNWFTLESLKTREAEVLKPRVQNMGSLLTIVFFSAWILRYIPVPELQLFSLVIQAIVALLTLCCFLPWSAIQGRKSETRAKRQVRSATGCPYASSDCTQDPHRGHVTVCVLTSSNE
jgi:hypothetical protein